MIRRRALLGSLVLVSLLFLGATVDIRVVEQWTAPTAKAETFGKLLVVAITDDRETRNRFEDKFVSHLRGRGIHGVTSHSIVPDLQVIEDIHAVIDRIQELEIDGAISIRLAPLDARTEADWSAAWREEAEAEGTLRELIEATLPVVETKAKKYGVEVALWGTMERSRIWAGRTGSYKRKQLSKGAGGFVQNVMQALKDARLF